MADKHFVFADFVSEFEVDFVSLDQSKGNYNDSGKWIQGTETPRPLKGIILPLSQDDLKFDPNGKYTTADKKLYTVDQLQIGQRIQYDGQYYTIEQEKPYQAYADVFIYFAKGVKVNE